MYKILDVFSLHYLWYIASAEEMSCIRNLIAPPWSKFVDTFSRLSSGNFNNPGTHLKLSVIKVFNGCIIMSGDQISLHSLMNVDEADPMLNEHCREVLVLGELYLGQGLGGVRSGARTSVLSARTHTPDIRFVQPPPIM